VRPHVGGGGGRADVPRTRRKNEREGRGQDENVRYLGGFKSSSNLHLRPAGGRLKKGVTRIKT